MCPPDFATTARNAAGGPLSNFYLHPSGIALHSSRRLKDDCTVDIYAMNGAPSDPPPGPQVVVDREVPAVAFEWTRVHLVVAVTLPYGVTCHAIDGSKKATVALKRPVHLPQTLVLTSVGRSYPHLCVLEEGTV